MDISNFVSGISSRKAPHLIENTQAQILINVDPSAELLEPVKGIASANLNFQDKAWYAEELDILFPRSNERNYLSFRDQVIYSNSKEARKYREGEWYNLGIDGPDNTPLATLRTEVDTTEELDETLVVRKLEYVYTYYNEKDDTESSPSKISTGLELPYPDTLIDVEITGIVPSQDPQVTQIFIYRLGAGLTAFIKVGEIQANATNYIDTKEVDDLGLGSTLTALNNDRPVGLNYLTKFGSTFFGARSTKLYFSKNVANPNYWPAFNYIEVGEHITSIAAVSNGLIVFSKFKTFILTGNTVDTYSLRVIHNTKGCLDHNSLAYINTNVAYVSNEGLQIATGSGVRGLTSDLIEIQRYDTVTAVLFDDVYYVLLEDKTMIAVDTRFGVFRVLNYDFQLDWIFRKENRLFGQKGGLIVELLAGETVSFVMKTKKFGSPLTTLKTFNKFFVACKGILTIKVIIDDIQVSEHITSNKRLPEEFHIPSDKQQGTGIEFEISGKGTLYTLKLDEKVVG